MRCQLAKHINVDGVAGFRGPVAVLVAILSLFMSHSRLDHAISSINVHS